MYSGEANTKMNSTVVDWKTKEPLQQQLTFDKMINGSIEELLGSTIDSTLIDSYFRNR